MRVILMPSSYKPVLGGLQTVVQTLGTYLLQNNHAVHVVTMRYPRTLPAHESHDGEAPLSRLTLIRPSRANITRNPALFAASLYYYPASIWRLNRLVQDFRPDVINVHFPLHQNPFVLWLRQRYQFRLVVSLHGHDVLGYPHRSATEQRLFRQVLETADAVTACSQFLLTQAVALHPGIANKSSVIYNGVDLARFANGSTAAHGRSYIFAYGRLINAKGFDLLIGAFAAVAAEFPDVDLVIAGDGEERLALEQQAASLSLQARIMFLGRREPDQIVPLLNGAEFVVIPSRSEPFGIVAIEAMAAGKAIIATNGGGLPEIVPKSINLLVEATAEALTAALYEWLKQPDAISIRGNLNRECAVDYDWIHSLRKYENSLQGSTA